MTQNFTVVEAQTEKKGVYVPVKDTIADVRAILDGKVDKLVPEDFLYIGSFKEIEEKLKTKSVSSTTEAINKGTQASPSQVTSSTASNSSQPQAKS